MKHSEKEKTVPEISRAIMDTDGIWIQMGFITTVLTAGSGGPNYGEAKVPAKSRHKKNCSSTVSWK